LLDGAFGSASASCARIAQDEKPELKTMRFLFNGNDTNAWAKAITEKPV
jgi:hypothetical protein